MYAYSVNTKLCLKGLKVCSATAQKNQAVVKTHHLLVLDCSGSMAWELPKIREQLKRKLPKLLGEYDVISAVWFSGRNEFGVLLEAEPVATLKDLSDVNAAIDRWLRPIGLTGFLQPLQEVSKVVERTNKKLPGYVHSLFFLSDGHDNCWSRPEILKTVEAAAGGLAASTFVEYGYYADRPLLTAMAEKSGGTLIHAADFDRYQVDFEAFIQHRSSGAPKIEVTIEGEQPVGGFVYTLDGGSLVTYAVEGGKVRLPEDTSAVWWVAPGKGTEPLEGVAGDVAGVYDGIPVDAERTAIAAAYAAVSLYSVRVRSDIVLPLLKAIGDVRLIKAFSGCFGKQKYSEFMDAAKAAAFEPKLRWTEGFDPKAVPADDATTVLDVLWALAMDDANTVLIDDPDFKYAKIGRARLDADSLVSDEEAAKIAEVTAKMASTKDAKTLKELADELSKLTAAKPDALKFQKDPAPNGYSIGGLVYNEDRPNVSIQVRRTGTVDISGRLPAALKDRIPASFPTFQFRNYAVLRDGLVNITSLPVRVTETTAKKLNVLLPNGFSLAATDGFVTGHITLGALPPINRKMVSKVSAVELLKLQYALEKSRAAAKVFKFYLDEKKPKKSSASWKDTYGEDGATWLKDNGFTDYSGWAPTHTKTAEATDHYVGKELVVALKGLSSLPKVADVVTKMASGKGLTISMSLMAPFIAQVDAYKNSTPFKAAGSTDEALIQWLTERSSEAVAQSRELCRQIAEIKYSIIIGQTWPVEFASLDENQLKHTLPDGTVLECTLKLQEVQIKI